MAPASRIIIWVTRWRCPDRSLASIWQMLWFSLRLSFLLLLIKTFFFALENIFTQPPGWRGIWLSYAAQDSAKQLILTVLGISLSWVDVELWITLKSWREPSAAKTPRQKDRRRLWRWRKPIFLVERYSRISGENPVIRDVHTWMKLPHRVFSLLPVPSLFCLLFLFHSDDLLLNLVEAKSSYRESRSVCVHGWQHSEMTVTGGGGCWLDNQSSANLISCCHTIFPLTITAPPLPSTPLPLFCQSWFSFTSSLHSFLHLGFILDAMLWNKGKILTANSLSCDWGLGCAEAHRPIINIDRSLFRFFEFKKEHGNCWFNSIKLHLYENAAFCFTTLLISGLLLCPAPSNLACNVHNMKQSKDWICISVGWECVEEEGPTTEDPYQPVSQ